MNRESLKLLVGFFLLLIVLIPSLGSYGYRGGSGPDSLPGPTLLYPVTDNINLIGKEFLEFKWRITSPTSIDHYELRLYKGYETIVSALIFQQNYPPEAQSIKMAAKQFEINQVYTWSLRLVYTGGRRGDFSFSPFKIIKK